MPLEEAPRILGFVYGLIVVVLVPYLLIRDNFSRNFRVALLFGAIASGILLFAPMTPVMFLAGLYQMKEFAAPLFVVFLGFSFFVLAAGVLGRSFCGFACPVGAVQELPYYVPVRKWVIQQSPFLLVLRGILISAFIILALLMVIQLFTVNVFLMRGVREVFLFSSLSIAGVLFLVLIGISVIFYRPFCRFACPYGALMSVAAWKSIFRLRRTPACTGCGSCETACPTGEILPDHQGNECYLCGRCMDACPVRAGIVYTRRKGRW